MRPVTVAAKDVHTYENAGSAPMLQWLSIADLVIDDRYQRELKRETWTVIRKIASAFKWSRFSPVFVAPIEGGKFAIIDGQCRTHAAALCGFERVPCQVVQMSVEEQAEAFAAVNGMVTKVTVWNLYRASLAAGTSWAVAVRNTASRAGCSVAESNASTASKKAGEIYAVDGFRRTVERYGEDEVALALKVLRGCKGWKDEAVYWEAGILLPFLDAICSVPHVLEFDHLQDALGQWPLWKHIDEIGDAIKKALRSGVQYRPRREQLLDRLKQWLKQNFPESAIRHPNAPLTVAGVPAAQSKAPVAPIITAAQRRQYEEARQRRARMGIN